jgi:hypothetical protein
MHKKVAQSRTQKAIEHLDLTLEEYFAAATLTGVLATADREPNKRWACEWSFAMGPLMAAEARRRRRKEKR